MIFNLVVCNAFFPTTISLTDSLSILVFSKYSELESPLIALNDNIHTTTQSVTIYTIITVLGTMLLTILLVTIVVQYITKPLEVMRHISEDVVKMITEDEENKDYTNLIQRAYNNILRNDEIGILASDYYHLILLLQDKLDVKRQLKKHIQNPFFIPAEWPDKNTFQLTLESFSRWYEHKLQQDKQQQDSLNQVLSSQGNAIIEVTNDNKESGDDLDILGSLTKHHNNQVHSTSKPQSHAPENPHFQQDPSEINKNGYGVIASLPDAESGLEMKSVTKANPTSTGYEQVSTGDDVNAISISFKKKIMRKIDLFNSLGSQLYLLAILILIGMIIAMVITVGLLAKDGKLWMSDSSDDLLSTAIVNLQGIASAKALFVKVSEL